MLTKKFDSKELVLERYCFEANGLKFEIKPITFRESWDFIHSGAFIPQKYKPPKMSFEDSEIEEIEEELEEYTEDELGFSMISLFKPLSDDEKSNNIGNSPIVPGYHNFSKQAQATIYWLQRKVYYNGKPIVFDDLETTYKLTKGQIAKMLLQLAECSGFSQLQRV